MEVGYLERSTSASFTQRQDFCAEGVVADARHLARLESLSAACSHAVPLFVPAGSSREQLADPADHIEPELGAPVNPPIGGMRQLRGPNQRFGGGG